MDLAQAYSEEIKRSILFHKEEGMSGREIARHLGLGKTAVNEFLKSQSAPQSYLYNAIDFEGPSHNVYMTPFNYDTYATNNKYIFDGNSSILVISDMHIPYHHKNLIPFLQRMKDKYKPTRVICIGDEADFHALSFHDSDPDLYSAGHELIAAQKTISQIHGMFPVMDLLDSNHGSLAYRRAKAHGIPKHYIKSYNDVLGVGQGWKWYHELVAKLPNGQDCYFHHGKMTRGIALAQQMGMNVVQGHFHSEFNINYYATPFTKNFSMQVGCLIDDKSLAIAYNKLTPKRPIIGCGVIVDSIPILESMDL